MPVLGGYQQNGHQHGNASGVTEAVVDVLETIAVEEQHCHPLVDLAPRQP